MIKKIGFLSVVILSGLCTTAFAQLPLVSASIKPDSIGIGDRFVIEINVDKDLTQVIDFPKFETEKIGTNLELVSESQVDTVSRSGRRVVLNKKYVMTIFDEGKYSLGKLGVLYLDKNVIDTLYTSDSLHLLVTTFEIDTLTQKIYDIKQPMRTPIKFEEYSGYLWLGFLLAQLIAALVYIAVKTAQKRKNKLPVPKVKSEPPHVAAIRELEILHSQKLWQNNRQKLYYTRLTDIIREYIENRYGINAMEMTSDEINQALAGILSDSRSALQLRRLLTTADYVKFAKYIPGTEDNEMSYSDAYYFVEETKSLAETANKDNDEEVKR